LVIVESGTSPDQPYVVLGDCRVDGLPPNLPEGSKIDVTISYDPQATVHVSAKDAASGKSAQTEILRQENIVAQLASDPRVGSDSVVLSDKAVTAPNPFKKPAAASPPPGVPNLADDKWEAFFDQTPSRPIPLCAKCGRPLDEQGKCPQCGPTMVTAKAGSGKPAPAAAKPAAAKSPGVKPPPRPAGAPPSNRQQTGKPPQPGSAPPSKPASTEVVKTQAQAPRKPPAADRPKRPQSASPQEEGEDEFWKFVGE
jgi:molecular chaperone DnaK